jgi:hypothetical protein
MDHAWSKDRVICDELWRHGLQCYDGDNNIQFSAWDSSVKKKEDVAGSYDLVFLSFTSEDDGPEFGRLKQSRTAIGTLELWDDADKPFVANAGQRHGESYSFQGKGRIDNAYSTDGWLFYTSFLFGIWTTEEGGVDRPGEGSIRDDAAPMEEQKRGADVTLKWIAGRTVLPWMPNDHATAASRDKNEYAEHVRRKLRGELATKIDYGLPDTALKKIHEYIVPPLELVLEEGDLVLEIVQEYYNCSIAGKLFARKRRQSTP